MNFASFSTTCPHCKAADELFVISGIFTTRIPLSSAGFSTEDASQFNTEDERVECGGCGKVFPLTEVTL